MNLKSLLLTSLLLVLGSLGVAHAGPKKPKKPACSSALHCARTCDARHGAACDRLRELMDDRLESSRGGTIFDPDPTIYTAARPNLAKACGPRNRRACVFLGRLEEQGRGGPVDTATAKTRFEEHCEAGEASACVALGISWQRGTLTGGDAAKIHATFRRACDAGDLHGCERLGLATADGVGVARDVVTGIGIVQDACKAGGAKACRTLGQLYRHGIGTSLAADASRSMEYSERGCDLGDTGACFDLAYGLGKADEATYYEKACAHDDANGCSFVVDKVEASRRAHFRGRACDLGMTWQCSALAREAKDEKTQRRYFGLACDAGDAESCVDLAMVGVPRLEYGKPIKAPPKKALARVVAALEKLCDDRSWRGCNELGTIYSRREYGARDLEKARRAFQRACDLDDFGECYDLQEVERLVKAEQKKGACDQGDLAACVAYARDTWYSATPPPAEAVAAAEKACKGKVLAGCTTLARDKKPDGATFELLVQSCAAGDAQDCTSAYYASLDLGREDEGLRALSSACDRGAAYSCAELGFAHRGREQPDLDAAHAAFEKACRLDAATGGCDQLAMLELDRKAAREEAACNQGDAAACLAVGERKAPSSLVDGLALYDRACKGKQARACAHAGHLRQSGGAGITVDPIRARDDLHAACTLGDAAVCGEVAPLWDQTGDRARAREAWFRACEGSVAGACASAVALLRDDGKEQKRYRAALDRGCMLGDAMLCDEARHGYRKPEPAPVAGTTSSYTPTYDGGYARPSRRGPSRLRVELGGFQVSPPDGATTFESYKGASLGADWTTRRGGSLHLVGSLGGALSYDEQSDVGHDAGAGVGVGYRLGPWHGAGLFRVGHDQLGSSGTPMEFGLDGSWYAGWELRGGLGLGAWTLDATYLTLGRSGEGSETRLGLSLEKLLASGRLLGIGVRSTDYDDAGSIAGFLTWTR